MKSDLSLAQVVVHLLKTVCQVGSVLLHEAPSCCGATTYGAAATAGAGVLTVMRATSGLVWQQTVEQHQ